MSNLTNDLTQRPPRSARVRLGGYVILPRMLDKGRATLAGKNGEYHYNCPMDQHFLESAGIDPEALQAEIATGKGYGEILEWITANSKTKPSPEQIESWSEYHARRGPTDVETRQFFNDYHAKVAPKREDIQGWFDVLDVDDYVSYGGKA